MKEQPRVNRGQHFLVHGCLRFGIRLCPRQRGGTCRFNLWGKHTAARRTNSQALQRKPRFGKSRIYRPHLYCGHYRRPIAIRRHIGQRCAAKHFLFDMGIPLCLCANQPEERAPQLFAGKSCRQFPLHNICSRFRQGKCKRQMGLLPAREFFPNERREPPGIVLRPPHIRCPAQHRHRPYTGNIVRRAKMRIDETVCAWIDADRFAHRMQVFRKNAAKHSVPPSHAFS